MTTPQSFQELGLSEELLASINRKGFEEPTAIQALTIPRMLADNTNIIAQAQTGTGKTAAFGLPLIDRVDTGRKEVQAVVLTPTRELAIQVSEEINSLKKDHRLKTIPIYGGQSISLQLRALKKGVHIVVGTPGRVIDHLKRKTLKLGGIDHLILDEADEMLNMGFIEDIEEIMEYTSADKRTLLFSATIPKRIRDLAGKYMKDHELISVKNETLTTSLTEQIYYEVRAGDKFEALCRIIDVEDDFYGLVFCRTKNDVDTVSAHLADRGYDADCIHGDITQGQREKTLDKFRKQKVNILVATDVAARGIDVINMTHVINYSLPQDSESYVHRIGRTGRAGNQGTAITFITPGEYKKLMHIQRSAGTDIKKSRMPDVQDIIEAKKKKIYDEISAARLKNLNPEYLKLAVDLMDDNDPALVLAATLNVCFEDELTPSAYTEFTGPDSREIPLDQQGKTRLFVGLGKKDKMTPKKMVRLITKRVPIKNSEINEIQIMDCFSFITVPFRKAEKVISSFKQDGRKPLISHARGKSDKPSRQKKQRAKDKHSSKKKCKKKTQPKDKPRRKKRKE